MLGDDCALADARPTTTELERRIDSFDWPAAERDLDEAGSATVPGLLTPEECAATAALYDEDCRFRSTVAMARHGFGRGEYRYFDDPLPAIVAALRRDLYRLLTPAANRWQALLRTERLFPDEHRAFVEECHAAGQTRPTPLLLRYGPGDYNCLHQDLYGAHIYPFQVVILLSAPGRDFTGGEFVLTEQRVRRQSRAEVVPLSLGDAAIFPVHHRPVVGERGPYRVTMRHGVSRLRTGRRHALGIIFHNAA